MTGRRKPWWMRLRPVFLRWPPGEYILPHEYAREFYVCCLIFEYRWSAIDHIRYPGIRLRTRTRHFGLEKR